MSRVHPYRCRPCCGDQEAIELWRWPDEASIAAREREAKAAAREADIERVAALERALVSVHSASFPEAQRTVLPPVEEVDPTSIQTQLGASAGVPVRGRAGCIYLGEFDRATFARASKSRDPAVVLSMSTEGVLNLKGKTEAVSPIALDGRPDLAGVLAAVERGLRG